MAAADLLHVTQPQRVAACRSNHLSFETLGSDGLAEVTQALDAAGVEYVCGAVQEGDVLVQQVGCWGRAGTGAGHAGSHKQVPCHVLQAARCGPDGPPAGLRMCHVQAPHDSCRPPRTRV